MECDHLLSKRASRSARANHDYLRSRRERTKKMAIVDSIASLFLLIMLILIIVLVFFACKPWRFLFSSRSRSSIKANELERPLVLDDANVVHSPNGELPIDYDLEGASIPNEGHFRLPRPPGLIYKQRLSAASCNMPQEDVAIGQTLKLSPAQLAEFQKHNRNFETDKLQDFVQRDILDQRSCLTLEVITGPSCGLHCSVQSTIPSKLPLTLGRVSPSDLLIKDSEVSGKHALINWNLEKMKWELVDMGSLNGTLLNSQPISPLDPGSRQWSNPIELTNGDIITLGMTSKVIVHITSQNKIHIPFGVGMASDPMSRRRGGKKLAMEDVCYYQWPLPGFNKFGLFGICDGHGGDGAARTASKLFPEIVANILSDSLKREKVVSFRNASNVLRDAFSQTEACLNHYYEGCTATVLLVWADGNENFFAQCANVGDSACVMNVDGVEIKMTEDHKIASYSERLRIEETGEPLRDGETRLYGINLARMLGDKFLKQQDSRFSSEPYTSQVVHMNQASRAFAILASDGLWDVMSGKKAIQLVLQMREKYSTDDDNSAEKIASFLLSEARTLGTKDNTSVIFLDFDAFPKFSCKDEC
ncbi:protein phosphatase 2C 70-like isoform X2 [Prosopis cineraria]|uniref:protein phosphatase 2C 70-like isoform X2 n=1 Tax=Prosopis cineraria TaxID=364024 RepID=UPI00240EAF61|nr:protein phosphatase 2C 70-like isoform X2 [Prosopis cineraria]